MGLSLLAEPHTTKGRKLRVVGHIGDGLTTALKCHNPQTIGRGQVFQVAKGQELQKSPALSIDPFGGDSTHDRGPSWTSKKETPVCCRNREGSTNDRGPGVGCGVGPPVVCRYGGDSINTRGPSIVELDKGGPIEHWKCAEGCGLARHW